MLIFLLIFFFFSAVPAGAIGARAAMLGKVHHHVRRTPRKRATNVATLSISHDLGVPTDEANSRSASPSPARQPATDTLNLSPDHFLKEEEQAAEAAEENEDAEPQIYLSRRYGLEVSAKDAALAAEQWKKSQTEEEKLSRKQRQRREHE